MTITTEDLKRATFWGHAICLDCGSEFEYEEDEFSSQGPCRACGSPRTYPAKTLEGILARVEPEGDDD